MEYLERFYESRDEEERLLKRCGRVEYITTMRYIERYLKAGMRVIEIGAGTGRYSHALARRGYRVDAVELVAHNIEVFKRNTLEGELVTIVQGNATDLAGFKDSVYDVTLLLGPMYHLFTMEDKLRALSEAVRVTKPDGVIFAAYCMADASILSYGFVRGNARELVEKGMLDPQTFRAYSNPWDIFELHRKEDIDALRAHFAVKPLHFVATDGYANHMRQSVEAMNEETFELFLRYHLATCERQDMVGYSHHTLDIFRKDGLEC